jgi:CHAT domain-containing protein
LTSTDPEELHRTGLLLLYHGDAARAVSVLEADAEIKPSTAILSDLSTAYLEMADKEDRSWLRVDALAASKRAVDKAPQEAYAAFNLALALERMSLAHESSLAWERYLSLESDSAWRNEAAEHLARLREPTTAERWEQGKEHLVSAAASGDQKTVSRLVLQFPRQTKELLEKTLLPAWADAVGTPSERTRLASARQVAETLALKGERLYVDAIAAIESRADAAHTLAEGHRAYAHGLELGGDCSRATPEFERARDRFSAGGSPMALAARYQQLVCVYRKRASDAEEPLVELASQLEGQPYPTLLARTEGMRGLCAMPHGLHTQAIAHYERAIQLLKNSGDTDVLNLLGMLDEAYRFLGDRDKAWGYRLESLRGAVAAGNRRLRHAVLAGFARDLIEKGRVEVAAAVLDEMLVNARAWSEPGAQAETLLRRIQLHLKTSSYDSAASDIAECAKLLEHYQQPDDRDHLESELVLVSAEQQLATKSPDALKTIQNAVSRLTTGGDGLLLPQALLDLGRAQIALGDPAAAEEAFGRALQLYEERRASTTGEELRISFFSTVQVSFDAMIRFQAIERGDARTAFAYSERIRARALRDRLEAGTGAEEPLDLDEQLKRIPPRVAVFAYTVLPEELVVWRLRQGSLTMKVLPVPRSKVAAIVASLRSSLSDAQSIDSGKAAAGKAFDLILRPLLEGVPAETELVFVPDRELNQVPFSALFNQKTGRFLIQDHACLVTPSLETYLAAEQHGAAAARKPRRVLAVGDPAFDTHRFTLPRLEYARKEAQAVAALYKDSIPLLGEDATRQRILDGLEGADVLHLAAHVVVDPRNPLRSIVATADSGSESLRASDLTQERLSGIELVFLSACDTAPGFADGDREGVAGLARAFLAAGVPSVVATLWAVNDQAAARLATQFHLQLLRGDSPEHALRIAQTDLVTHVSEIAPFAWASFQLYRGGHPQRSSA